MPICHNKQYEREFVRNMIKQGHHCERIAGSGCGSNSVCDAILFRDGRVFLVEVKATKDSKIYARKHIVEQLDRMTEVAKSVNAGAMLAIKFKRKGWELRELL